MERRRVYSSVQIKSLNEAFMRVERRMEDRLHDSLLDINVVSA